MVFLSIRLDRLWLVYNVFRRVTRVRCIDRFLEKNKIKNYGVQKIEIEILKTKYFAYYRGKKIYVYVDDNHNTLTKTINSFERSERVPTREHNVIFQSVYPLKKPTKKQKCDLKRKIILFFSFLLYVKFFTQAGGILLFYIMYRFINIMFFFFFLDSERSIRTSRRIVSEDDDYIGIFTFKFFVTSTRYSLDPKGFGFDLLLSKISIHKQKFTY